MSMFAKILYIFTVRQRYRDIFASDCQTGGISYRPRPGANASPLLSFNSSLKEELLKESCFILLFHIRLKLQLLTWKLGSGRSSCDPTSWPRQNGGNPNVDVTHGSLFSQHRTAVYAPDILSVNDLVSSD